MTLTMKQNVTITGRLACILIALAFTWGCSEQPDAARRPKVIRKKITTTAKSPSPARKKPSARTAGKASVPRPKSAIARAEPPNSGQSPQKVSSGKASAASQQGLRPKSDIARLPVPSKSAQAVARKPESQAKQPSVTAAIPAAGSTKTALRPKSEPSAGKPAAVATTGQKESVQKKPAAKKKGAPKPYDPEGKVDPFKPLFDEKPQTPQRRSRPKRIPRTPLERLALSQLKLTAIILAASGNRALVQEASGKGYVIENGTYIGLNAGKVIEIQKDRVIIEEEVEDLVGKLVKRKQQLKLPKPAGDS